MRDVILPSLETRLETLLDEDASSQQRRAPGRRIRKGVADPIEWYCIPIAPDFPSLPRRIRQIVVVFYDLVRVLLDCITFRGYIDGYYSKTKGFDETVATLVSTMYVLEYAMGLNPLKGRYAGYATMPHLSTRIISGSLFKSFHANPMVTDMLRKHCVGYLLLARTRGHHLMSMTVWERPLTDRRADKDVSAQEHALIVKNPLLPPEIRLRNISMKMHSFAADTVGQDVVVCVPYKTMSKILMKNIDQGRIDSVRKYTEKNMECIAFGSFFQIVNNEKLRNVWKTGRAQQTRSKEK